MSHLSYFEAIVVGAFQGFSELFPISSLGHSILIPALVGGQWAKDLNVSAPESPYLAFIVGLHVATACALLLFFWRDWVRIITGFFTSIAHRRIETSYERLAWLIVIATIPVGISGLLLEHLFRTTLGRPIPAAVFLLVNGLILLAGERMRRREPLPGDAAYAAAGGGGLTMGDVARRGATRLEVTGEEGLLENQAVAKDSDLRLAKLSFVSATLVGFGSDPRPLARHQPFRSHHGCRTHQGPLARGRREVLLPPGHPGHLRGRSPEDPRSFRTARQRHPRPSPRWQHRLLHHRLSFREVPDPLLPNQDPHPVRHLQHRDRRVRNLLAHPALESARSSLPLRVSTDERLGTSSWFGRTRTSGVIRLGPAHLVTVGGLG